MLKNIKEKSEEKKFLTFYKNNGKFYHTEGIDSYVMNYLFGYKVLDGRKSGFPESAYNKVINLLENKKISYEVIYTDRKSIRKDYRKINKYFEICRLAKTKMDYAERIDILINKILNYNGNLDNLLEKFELCLK